jgi:hypothetical protein
VTAIESRSGMSVRNVDESGGTMGGGGGVPGVPDGELRGSTEVRA